jgi:hypothetical protein
MPTLTSSHHEDQGLSLIGSLSMKLCLQSVNWPEVFQILVSPNFNTAEYYHTPVIHIPKFSSWTHHQLPSVSLKRESHSSRPPIHIHEGCQLTSLNLSIIICKTEFHAAFRLEINVNIFYRL